MSLAPPDPRGLTSGCSSVVTSDKLAVYVGKSVEDLYILSAVVIAPLIPFSYAV